MAGSSPAFAAGPEGPIARGAAIEAKRLVAARASQAAQQPAPRQRSWVSRHPALFGAIVGAPTGAVVGWTSSDCRDDFLCFQGAAAAGGALIGAGVGSLTGFIIGRAKR